MELTLWHLGALAGVGAVAGFINVMAGGGSLLTMPAMIFLGLPPAAANGTNRVALLVQNATVVGEFRRRGLADFRTSVVLALCTLPGAVIGAIAAVRVDPLLFKRLLAAVMVAVLIAVLGPKTRKGTGPPRRLAAYIGMVGVGFYGGFMQAGVGFLIIATLHRLLQLDLVRVNMHKVFVIMLYTVPSLAIFALSGNVYWGAGLILGVGNAAGGWLGTHVQVTRGEGVVRVVLVVAVLAMALKLLVP